MRPVDYLVVEMSGLQESSIAFTRRHPSTRIDQIVSTAAGLDGPVYHVTAYARGIPEGAMDEYVAGLAAAFGAVGTTRRDDRLGVWLGDFIVPAATLADASSVAISRFLDKHGLQARWTRIEQGRFFLRAVVPEPVDAREMAGQLRGYLDALAIQAHVDVEVERAGSPGPWKELLEEVFASGGRRLPPGFGD